MAMNTCTTWVSRRWQGQKVGHPPASHADRRALLLKGAFVMTDSRMFENLYFTKAARPIAAIVRGSQIKVIAAATFTPRSPR